jgi:abequosyltransferase
VRLSVCIATYNRAGVIGETLASILPQLGPDVELLVVDGASTDDTAIRVASCLGSRTDARYVRLAKKGGVDQDYALTVSEARGEYCWLMTDDDIVKPGAIARILDALADDPDLVVVNAEVAGPDLASTLLARKLDDDADRTFAPGDDEALFARTGDLLTFIGATVIRRATWLARDVTPYFGTEFVHVGVIFQAPLTRGARLIAEPLVRIRYGVAGWSARAFEVWMFKWPRLVWSFTRFSEAVRARVTPREPWRQVGRLITMKAQGAYTMDAYRRWLAPLDLPAGTRILAAAIAWLPRPVFTTLMRLAIPLLPARERAMMRFELDRSL